MVRAWNQRDAAEFIRIQANATAPSFRDDELQKWRRVIAAAASQNYDYEYGRRHRRQRRRGGFIPEDFS